MKAARRQELKSNDLAESLEELREFLRTYGNYVFGGLVVIALVVVAYVYNTRSAQQARLEATRQLRTLPITTDEEVRDSVQKLTSLAADAKDETVVLEALRRRAQMSIQRAHAAEDGTPSAEFLDMAAAAYQEMLDRFGSNPVDLGVALIGLATIEEDRFVLDNDPSHQAKAKSYLERVRDSEQLTGTPFQSVALDRLNALDRTFVAVALFEPPPVPSATALPSVVPPSPPPAQITATPGQPASPADAQAAAPKPAAKKAKKPKRRGRKPPLLRPVPAEEVPIGVREQLNKRLDRLEEKKRREREAKEAEKTGKKKAEPADDSTEDQDEENKPAEGDDASDADGDN
ncbi:MAG: hypothetical protein ACE5GE_10090 [Phycisphaerae bacterium]